VGEGGCAIFGIGIFEIVNKGMEKEVASLEKEWIETKTEFLARCATMTPLPTHRLYVLVDLASMEPGSTLACIPEQLNCFVFASSSRRAADYEPSAVIAEADGGRRKRTRLIESFGGRGSNTICLMSAFCGALVQLWKDTGCLIVLVTDDIEFRRNLLRQFSVWKIFGMGFGSTELECLKKFLNRIAEHD
jgi:hypothetical protein